MPYRRTKGYGVGRAGDISRNGGKSGFTLWDATPSLFQAGRDGDWSTYVKKNLYVAYQSYFTFPSGTSELPSQASVEDVADNALTGTYSGACLDIESWPRAYYDSSDTSGDYASTKSKWEQVLQWHKAAAPNQPVGTYGYTPMRSYTESLLGEGNATYETWQSDNDLVSPQRYCDLFFPSLYVLSDVAAPYANIKTFIQNNIAEAKRFSGTSRLVVPFIWPLFHESVSTRYQAITAISGANPAVVTVGADMGMVTGEQVYLYGMTGATELEGNLYTVTRNDARNFALQGVDGGAITAWSSGGVIHSCLPGTMWTEILHTLYPLVSNAAIFMLGTSKWAASATWWANTKTWIGNFG